MPLRSTGMLAACVALVVGGCAQDVADRGVVPRHADAICAGAVREASRLPRGSIARAAGMARILRSTASALRLVGADDLAWAHQRWAAAIDDVRQALRRRGGSARAGATALIARTDAAVAAQELRAKRCVELARGG